MSAAAWAALLAGVSVVLGLLNEWRRWRSRPSTSWSLVTQQMPPIANSDEWRTSWWGRLECLGDAEAYHVFIWGRHCMVVPRAEDGVMTLIRPGEVRRLNITVERPEDADKAWLAIEWRPPPYRGSRIELLWLPMRNDDDSPLLNELVRQLGQWSRRWWMGRFRKLPRWGVGPGRAPRISIGRRRGRRILKRQLWAGELYARSDPNDG